MISIEDMFFTSLVVFALNVLYSRTFLSKTRKNSKYRFFFVMADFYLPMFSSLQDHAECIGNRFGHAKRQICPPPSSPPPSSELLPWPPTSPSPPVPWPLSSPLWISEVKNMCICVFRKMLNRWTGQPTDGWTNGRIDGQTDGQTLF